LFTKKGKIKEFERQIDNYIDQIGQCESRSVKKRCEVKIEQLEKAILELRQEMKHDEQELDKAITTSESFQNWTHVLQDLLLAIKEESAAELRLKLRNHLQEFIDRVEVFAIGYTSEFTGDETQLIPRQQSNIENDKRLRCMLPPKINADTTSEWMYAIADDYAPELYDDPEFPAFVRYVTNQRMSKKGRFYRLYFKNGRSTELVPDGSLATGLRLCVSEDGTMERQHVTPNLEILYQDFQKELEKKSVKQGGGKLATIC